MGVDLVTALDQLPGTAKRNNPSSMWPYHVMLLEMGGGPFYFINHLGHEVENLQHVLPVDAPVLLIINIPTFLLQVN